MEKTWSFLHRITLAGFQQTYRSIAAGCSRALWMQEWQELCTQRNKSYAGRFTYRDDQMGKPGRLWPPSTMNVLPVMYWESSLASKITSDVKSGSTAPHFPAGTIFVATLCSHSFWNRSFVISDLNNPAAMAFVRMLWCPSSIAIIWSPPQNIRAAHEIKQRSQYNFFNRQNPLESMHDAVGFWQRGGNRTLERCITAALDVEYAKPPGNKPRSMPPIDEMLIMEPPLFAATNRFDTALDMSHVPRKLVLKMAFHSCSSWSMGVLTGPANDLDWFMRWSENRSLKPSKIRTGL